MKCPKCQSETRILETREVTPQSLRRRRECPQCQERLTTVEVPVGFVAEIGVAITVTGMGLHAEISSPKTEKTL